MIAQELLKMINIPYFCMERFQPNFFIKASVLNFNSLLSGELVLPMFTNSLPFSTYMFSKLKKTLLISISGLFFPLYLFS